MSDEIKGTPENPFTREEMVEKMGEEAVAEVERTAVPAPVEAPATGKPVGPATIVEDEPMVEQFPAHEADTTL